MAGEKQLKTVIRGLPSDFDVDEIIQELGTHNITPEHVSVMRNRKQNKNMPLFLVVSRKCPANQAIFQVTSIGWNANSVKYKLGELRNFLCDEDPDIIGIQETHLGPADSFKLPNYICHRSDRLSHRGGGTAIFVRNSLRHHVVSFNTSTFENTTVRIELGNNTHLTLSCIYKPPRNHINTSELDAILNASPKRQIKTQISEHRNNSWHNLLTNLHPEDNSLYNLQRKLVKKPTIIPPLAGRNGILYSDDEKAEEFKNNLEATFQENAEPYNDQIIELVESETSDFLANSSMQVPPLTSPAEISKIISKLQNKKSFRPR
ncbi:uncharacterized protein TNCV_4540091 [Trichonephila clavipes]|nr:uncharacterized protein TNCV_4540091 [Trichonephila clavipes]